MSENKRILSYSIYSKPSSNVIPYLALYCKNNTCTIKRYHLWGRVIRFKMTHKWSTIWLFDFTLYVLYFDIININVQHVIIYLTLRDSTWRHFLTETNFSIIFLDKYFPTKKICALVPYIISSFWHFMFYTMFYQLVFH